MKKIGSYERNSIIVFALTMIANVCNYCFQIIVGKMMLVEEYAQVNTILAIVSIFSIPTTIITMICARYIALNYAEKNEENIISVMKILMKMVFVMGMIVAVILLVGGRMISSVFGLYSSKYLAGVFIVTFVNMVYAITTGSLQGMKKFVPYGVQSIATAGGKVVFSVAFILIGWSVGGVIAGIIIGIIIAIAIGVKYIYRYIISAIKNNNPNNIDINEFFRFALGTLVAQGCVIALTNGDVLLVKAYFSDTEAGLYSSAMVIGKIAMYVSSAVIATLFPTVVEQHERGNDTTPLFRKAMLYGGGVAVLCAIGMVLFGKLVIGILFGTKYLQAIEYLPAVCAFVVPLTFITILMNYSLAINETKEFNVLIAMGLVGIIAGSYFVHDTVGHLLYMVGGILLAVFVISYIILKIRKRKNVKV
ncbi:MAG: oligosaccharide flippase family protein [Lachnobacterium sp.]|nr:oligosaccharide flippase family protein [Lachnobacterium sp.]